MILVRRGPAEWFPAIWLRVMLCALLGISIAVTAWAQATSGMSSVGPRRARLYGIASSRVFNHLNHDDARLALKVWFDLIAEQRGFVLDSRVDIVDTPAEVRKRLDEGTVDVMMLGVTDYLELESSHLAVPVMTDARGPQAGAQYSYVLLAGRSTTAAGVAGLRGKNILVASRGEPQTGMAWAEVLLSKEHLGRAATFFASVKSVDKAQACILPVFFGTADACVVDEINLNLAKELNPQLGQVRVLARSRPLIESLVATPVKPHPYQQELLESMLTLHRDPRGRQLLMVFKIDRLVPIQAGDFDSARELWRDYDRLAAAALHRPTGTDREQGGH